jgi:ABC-type Fe3+ transport system substrate-binding protein
MRVLWVLAALAAVILIPVALRPRDEARGAARANAEVLVIISPHNEATRYEFSRAFEAAHRAKTGRTVRIDWRTPGGTSEISRYLASEYLGAFRYYWEQTLHQPWDGEVQAAFDNPRVEPTAANKAGRVRKLFLESRAGCGIDLLFGGGSYDLTQQAAAGRLVDCGVIAAHPERFGEGGLPLRIPQILNGEPLWDPQGRWLGVALSAFGICYNSDALARLGVPGKLTRWSDLADPCLKGNLALADPSASGSAAKAFEMLIQQQMVEAGGDPVEGWTRAMRLIRRIAANARYFTDSGPQVPWDVQSGNAAAGMAIDFYGRYQSESVRRPDGSSRVGYVTPAGGSSVGADPIGMLRGAPSPELAREFIEFTLSPQGQKLWNWKAGMEGGVGGPQKYALRRLPILPELYAPEFARFRSDPEVDPYQEAKLDYRAAWTGTLLRTIGFVVKTMGIDSHEELRGAWDALVGAKFPPQATALFDDVRAVDYRAATGPLKAALGSQQKIDQVRLGRTLGEQFRAQYARVAELAKAGK